LFALRLLFALQKHKADPPQQQQQPATKKLKGSGIEIEQQHSTVSGIMSHSTFSSLELSQPTAQGVEDMQFTHMTEVQV
jgi:superfamily II DNA/RNA helicase